MIQMCLALIFYMMLAVLLGSQTSSAQSNPEDFADSSGPCACRNGQCRELFFTPSTCEYKGSSKSCRVSDDCDRARETFFGKYLCCTDEEEEDTDPGDDDYGPSYTEVEDCKINCAIKKQTINFSNIGEVTLDVCSSYCGCYQENGQYVKVEQFREGESIGEYYTCNECSEKWVEECERELEMYETINENNGKV